MDKQGFRAMLQARKLSEERIDSAIAMVERFESYITSVDGTFPPTYEKTAKFLEILIQEGLKTLADYAPLFWYCLFTKNKEMNIAVVEVIEGMEAPASLYRKVGETFGGQVRDEIFSGLGLKSVEIPPDEKPLYMHTLLSRLENKVGQDACKNLLADSLENLPDALYWREKELYAQCANIDIYLEKRRQVFLEQLEASQRDNFLFAGQEITDDVLDFVRSNPEIGGGIRKGNVIYETKIPFQTKRYLEEPDETLKRYHVCFCPWVNKAIKNGGVNVVESFCECTAGYHKRPFEVALGLPLKAEILESALRGDSLCRIAIYLPEEVTRKTGNDPDMSD